MKVKARLNESIGPANELVFQDEDDKATPGEAVPGSNVVVVMSKKVWTEMGKPEAVTVDVRSAD